MKTPPDRDMTLVADEGMRILRPSDTLCPYFLASNDKLWEAWRELQRQSGAGRAEEHWLREGWRIFARNLPSGSTVMTLEVRFDKIDKSSAV